MSDQEAVVGKRRINKLSLDSDEEARIQAQQQQRLEQIRLKKEEKRRRKEEEARQVQQEQKKQQEMQRHYEDPQTMLEPDSDSGDAFERAEKKIRKAFPEIKPPRQQSHHKRRHVSQSEQSQQNDSEEDDSEQSEEDSSEEVNKKRDTKKKQRKQRKREESEEARVARNRPEKVKIEEKDPKEVLVGQIAIRWWYCLPEWPPVDFDYEAELKKLGYRLVDNTKFRMEQNLVNGLFKATPIDGYVGVFKSKQKIIDVRPKQTCPSLQLLRSKTMQELTGLLRKALKEQISALSNQKYQGSEDTELITKLTRRLNLIS